MPPRLIWLKPAASSLRYSGTEPLARVMIEAESEEAMKRHAEAIAAAIRAELGA